MTSLTTMYAGQTNSPATTLAANITSTATSISVTDASALPAVPFPLTIGINSTSSETVLVTAKSGNTLTVTRGWDGTASAWNADTPCARVFTAKDLNTAQSNITALNTGKAEKTDVNNSIEQLYEDVFSSSASGSIASYYRTVGGLPVDDLTIDITPVQAGTGDPSPTNVRAISGWTGANVTRAGKNLVHGMEWRNSVPSINTGAMVNVKGYSSDFLRIDSAREYVVSRSLTTGTLYLLIYDRNKAFLQYKNISDGTSSFNLNSNTISSWASAEYVKIRYDTTVEITPTPTWQLELGSIATAYEPYAGSTTSISWNTEAGTVYGGTLDVTTGLLTVTDANIASYAGETLPSTWISSKDVYAAGTTPTTGAQVVYKLAIPLTYQLTPTQVSSLLGENNVWADTGDVYVTFGADIKSYIDETAAGFQDEITASGILKGDGAGGVSAAVAGTDYQAPLTAGTDYQTPLDEKALQWYGVCSTSASTQAKTVSITGITALTEGLEIRVKMTNAQTYNGTPTLNVNSLGAKTIKQHGSTDAVRYQWQAGEVISFTYDGTYWVIENNSLATTTYFGLTRLNSATNSTAEDCAATPKAVKTAYDLADAAIPATEKGTNVATLATAADSTTPSVPRITPAQSFAPLFTITADTTLAAKHAGGILVCTNSPTITIPSNVFAEATQIEILNYGTGVVTIAGASGCSVNGTSAGSVTLADQYKSAVLLAISASQWVVQGAIE